MGRLETVKLEMKKISIEFPGVKALSDVDFQVGSGEIRGLVGANGAGKSTLMKILAGANETYTGDIYLDGRHYEIRNPIVAKNLGIEIVYQEVDTAIFPELTVAENIMFNTMVNGMDGRVRVDWGEMRRSAEKILAMLHVNIDVGEQAGRLPLSQKQMVLIARAVSGRCRFLVLDEPTAPLSMAETQELFHVVRQLAEEQNVGIIFISHRLAELFQICKTITIMRDGRIVAERSIDGTIAVNDIVNLMLGRKFEENFPKKAVDIGNVVLKVEGLSDADNKVKDVSFFMRKGEIVGVSGLVGAGKTELCKILFGAMRKAAGKIEYKGRELNINSPAAAVGQKIAFIPEERRKEGVFVSEPVYFNLSAACLKKFANKLSFINKKAERETARQFIKIMGIATPSDDKLVKYLSGGNQQKVVVGKWLIADADVYIMDEPTKGVDVGAKRDIFELVCGLAAEGKTILFVSSEISEILAITDRLYVMYNGSFVAEFPTPQANEEKILYYSTGGK